MMRTTAYGLAAAFACGAAMSAFACGDASDAEREIEGELADAGADSSSPLDPFDAAVADAGLDADAAAPSRCSHEGWCEVDIPAHQDLAGVWGDGQGTAWTVGSCIDDPATAGSWKRDGCILRWNGARFEKVFSVRGELEAGLSAIWGSGPTDIWAGGTAGLFHGQGASSSSIVWTRVELAAPLDVRSIWGTSANDVWLTGIHGPNLSGTAYVLHYTGESAAWALDLVSSLFASPFPLLVFGRAADDVWVTGASASNNRISTIAHLGPAPDGGVVWTDVTPPNSVFTNIAPGGSAAHSSAGIAVTAGEAWLAPYVLVGDGVRNYPARLRLGAADAGDGGAVDLTLFEDVGDYTADGAWDTVNAFWGTSSSDVWMVAEHGRVRHWDGTNWTLSFISSSAAPLLANLRGIWGAGASADIWVVGGAHALHRVAGKNGAQ